ncbi:hypothetical protein SBOR_9872 [Sclerotinia borealis F-4128]|uniref:Uncharacterized protein n=1 Tax=Sclerotinia borealis (strain F-4128) TaxID=1432307 RepID=W9C594_SCLBF|nr:hypothetical protein SBOR_9872 [Sclerotinia borealis F-4128]
MSLPQSPGMVQTNTITSSNKRARNGDISTAELDDAVLVIQHATSKIKELLNEKKLLVNSARVQSNTIAKLQDEVMKMRSSERKALDELNKFLKADFEREKLSGLLEEKVEALREREVENDKLKKENQRMAVEGYKMIAKMKGLEDSRMQIRKLLTDA